MDGTGIKHTEGKKLSELDNKKFRNFSIKLNKLLLTIILLIKVLFEYSVIYYRL